MSWHGHLSLHYRVQQGRTVALDRHTGPLRVLQRLYPEGDAICHHVLVHPPGGLVGGDSLALDVQVDAGAHALITTPGATRFYRSEGLPATQCVNLQVAAGARLEWLPMETIAHPGCEGSNDAALHLAPGAEMMGWDVLALGLPASSAPFDAPPHSGSGGGGGSFTQRLHAPGLWLEQARIAAVDHLLLHSPLGLAGQSVVATMWFAAGQPLSAQRLQALQDAARQAAAASPLAGRSGCTAPDARLVLLRVLAPRVEPALQLLQTVWQAWRGAAWALPAPLPRMWRT